MQEPIEEPVNTARPRGFWTWSSFRDVCIGLLLFVIAFRLAFAETTIDLSGFNFTDLLSLILALAAVALSAAFYFKADESARSFYNNTYHFTKEVSEILGRIEAGFGKQLEHINQSYVGLNDKIDRMPFDPSFIREQEEAKRSEIQEQEAERDDIIQDLMRRAQMDDAEKASMQEKLDALTNELEYSKAQLAYFQTLEPETGDSFGFSQSGVLWLSEKLAPLFPKNALITDRAILLRFRRAIKTGLIGGDLLNHMEHVGLVSGEELTPPGITFVRSILKKRRASSN
ncbi:hypothetical protein G1E_25776 [Pseudomonas sp. TJI-51]|uniref:hypothetical protein n=1 Tax=Pseudomonas TaxID=286 RepID=UPI0001FB8E94|nr:MULTISPECIES: hypothetical protein [Pseudomonas]EGB96023.1 hypothetical protein G1E_25776 [Pseudomonas sp. TJI-51]